LSREDLVAYYKAADVMLVTPLRDGMNLVAKEYIATRTDNTGVLVLSEFTGAARQLRRALIVNPRDLNQTADALRESLTMSASAAKVRMTSLRAAVRRSDVFAWADDFVSALRGPSEDEPNDHFELKPMAELAEPEPAGA
jgi:trehalose-6-phosphate synthase